MFDIEWSPLFTAVAESENIPKIDSIWSPASDVVVDPSSVEVSVISVILAPECVTSRLSKLGVISMVSTVPEFDSTESV